MRTIFGVKAGEAILFAVSTLIYLVISAVWTIAPLVPDAAGEMVSLADSDLAFLQGMPLIGDLPAQSISKFVICVALYLVALIYGLIAVAQSEYRRYLPQITVIGILSFLAWNALNLWVIAGFLNALSIWYGVASVVLLGAWGAAVMYGVSRVHDATAVFLVRFGLGLAMFITIVQIVAVLTPEWRSPTQGIPVLYNLTFNALVGIFLAGAGGNMLWREKRAQALAAASKRR